MVEFLKYENLYLHYGTSLVLKNLSGSLESGKLYVLSGENGAGKTSLLNVLSGKIAPNKGIVSGAKFNRECIKALIGASFLYSHLSIQDNFEIFSDSKISEVLNKYDLKKYANSLIRNLSQGYVQRVSLAIVLSSKADIVILDEPTNFLDLSSKKLLLAEFEKALSLGRTIFISSHEPNYFTPLNPVLLELNGGEYV